MRLNAARLENPADGNTLKRELQRWSSRFSVLPPCAARPRGLRTAAMRGRIVTSTTQRGSCIAAPEEPAFLIDALRVPAQRGLC